MVRRVTSPVKKPKKRKYTTRTSRSSRKSRSYTTRRNRKNRSRKLHPPGYLRQTFDNLLGTYGPYSQTGLVRDDIKRDFSFEEPDISDTSDTSGASDEEGSSQLRPVYSADLPNIPSLDTNVEITRRKRIEEERERQLLERERERQWLEREERERQLLDREERERQLLDREEREREERIEEGIYRIAEYSRRKKEEYDMLVEEAMDLYPGRGERLKLLRAKYIKNELLRRREEEERMEQEKRLRLLRRSRPVSVSRPSTGSRRTSPRRTSPRRGAFDTFATGASSIANSIDRAVDYFSRGFDSLRKKSPIKRKTSRKSTSPIKRKTSRKPTSPRSSAGSGRPAKEKVQDALKRTSPRKRKNPKKKRKTRIAEIEDPKSVRKNK